MERWDVINRDDGNTVHYIRTGGEKPSVVLAHGLSANGLCWTRTSEALEGDFELVMIDARNHGQSSTATGDATAMDGDIVAVTIALGLERPAVVGHSIGAHTAAELAIAHPALVSRLVLEEAPWNAETTSDDETSERRDGARAWVAAMNSWVATQQISQAGHDIRRDIFDCFIELLHDFLSQPASETH